MGYHKENKEKCAKKRREEELKKKFENTPPPPEPGGVPIRIDKNTVIYKKQKP